MMDIMSLGCGKNHGFWQILEICTLETLSWLMWRRSSTYEGFNEVDDGIEGNNVIWRMYNHDSWTLVQGGDYHLSLKINTFRFMLPLCDYILIWIYCFGYYLYFLHVYFSIWILLTSWWVVISGYFSRIMASVGRE